MTNALPDNSTLPSMLQSLSTIDFSIDERDLKQAQAAYDYVIKYTLTNKIVATPRSGSQPVTTRLATFNPCSVYVIEAQPLDLDICFRTRHGTGVATSDHYVYDIYAGRRPRGRIDYFPNNGFAFTNKEPCQGLTMVSLDDRRWTLYRSEVSVSWLTSMPYSIALDDKGARVAIIAVGAGMFMPKTYLKCVATVDKTDVALLMALHNGLVFRR